MHPPLGGSGDLVRGVVRQVAIVISILITLTKALVILLTTSPDYGHRAVHEVVGFVLGSWYMQTPNICPTLLS